MLHKYRTLKKRRNHQRGYTITEVMFVLAIAGLIIMVALMALSELQRIQRDNARKNIANTVKSELESYASNSQGVYPLYTGGSVGDTGAWIDFYTRYIQNRINVKDPLLGTDMVQSNANNYGKPIQVSQFPGAAGNNNYAVISGNIHTGELYIILGKCNGDRVDKVDANAYSSQVQGRYAIVVGLENDGTYNCIDNL
jgi:prepilin-type N-terminal cleavage/methylation domain-containing protein